MSCLWSATAAAEILSVNVLSSDPGAVLPGYVANDVFLDFDSMLLGQQLSLQLTQGSILQSGAAASDTAPSQVLIRQSPDLAYDSFVTMGGLDDETSAPVITVGGAVDLAWKFDLNVSKAVVFDSRAADITWAAQPGTRILAGEDFLTARLTLSGDAQGTFRYLCSTRGSDDFWIGEAQIVNGTIGQLTRKTFEPVLPVTLPVATPPVVPPTIEPVLLPVDPIAAESAVEQEPIVDPVPPELTLEFPPIVVEGLPGESEIDPPLEGLPTEVYAGGWMPPTFIDLPIQTMPIDPSAVKYLIGITHPIPLYLTMCDTDVSLGDLIGSASSELEKAVLYSRSNASTFGSAIAYGQTVTLATASVPEPSSQVLQLWLTMLALRSIRRPRD